MWLFIKSLFMVKDRITAKEMVDWRAFKANPAGFRIGRLLRRRAHRSELKAQNTTQLKYKAK